MKIYKVGGYSLAAIQKSCIALMPRAGLQGGGERCRLGEAWGSHLDANYLHSLGQNRHLSLPALLPLKLRTSLFLEGGGDDQKSLHSS